MEYRLPSNLAYVILVKVVVVATALFCLVVRANVQAQTPALVPSLWYGGRIAAYVPMIPNPAVPAVPLCPAHMVIADISSGSIELKGIYFLGDGTFSYLYSSLLSGSTPYFMTPGLPLGAWALGRNLPIPYSTCSTPYQVYASDTNELNYFLGTSLTP